MGNLAGKHALVTGGGHGLGRELARALCAEGMHVTVTGRGRGALEETAASLGARARVMDVTDARAVAEAVGAIGTVHVLVNNAGLAPTGKLESLTEVDFRGALEVNALGAFLCIQSCLPTMRAAGFGRILNIASTTGVEGGPYLAAYAASKHALVGLTRAAAAELSGTGITVHALCPAYIDTDMAWRAVDAAVARKGWSRDEALAAVLKSAGQARLIAADEVAARMLSLFDSEETGHIEIMRGEAT